MNGSPVGRAAGEFAAARRRLVRKLVDEGIVRSALIQSAFLDVPREAFVPADSPGAIYSDTTIPLEGEQGGWLTTSSQPTMMALMLEQLRLARGHRVLEIGAGTGYNAALLAHIVGPSGSVHSVEYEPEAAVRAARALAAIGSSAIVHRYDGADGWEGGAPYDRIIATVAVCDLPPAWSSQALPDARIVVPLTLLGGDYSVALVRDESDWVGDSIEPCSFVRFKGRLAAAEIKTVLGGINAPILSVHSESVDVPEPKVISTWLEEGQGEPIRGVGTRDSWEGFALHLLFGRGPAHVLRAVSYGHGLGWQGHAVGLWDEDGFAVVTSAGRLERFGDGDSADVVRTELAAWRANGSPDLDACRLRFRAGKIDQPGWLPKSNHSIHLECRA